MFLLKFITECKSKRIIKIGHISNVIVQIKVNKRFLWLTVPTEFNKKAQLSLTNPRDAFRRIVVYGVGVFFCVNVSWCAFI